MQSAFASQTCMEDPNSNFVTIFFILSEHTEHLCYALPVQLYDLMRNSSENEKIYNTAGGHCFQQSLQNCKGTVILLHESLCNK